MAPPILMTRPNAKVEFVPEKLLELVLSLHPLIIIEYKGNSCWPADVFCISAAIPNLGELSLQAFMEHAAEPYRPATMKNYADIYFGCAPAMVPIGAVDEAIWNRAWSDKARFCKAEYGAGHQFTTKVETFKDLQLTLLGILQLAEAHHSAASKYNAGAEAERQKYIDKALREKHIGEILGT